LINDDISQNYSNLEFENIETNQKYNKAEEFDFFDEVKKKKIEMDLNDRSESIRIDSSISSFNLDKIDEKMTEMSDTSSNTKDQMIAEELKRAEIEEKLEKEKLEREKLEKENATKNAKIIFSPDKLLKIKKEIDEHNIKHSDFKQKHNINFIKNKINTKLQKDNEQKQKEYDRIKNKIVD